MSHKYTPTTAPSYIKLKRDFANSKLETSGKDPDEWITKLESLKTEMNKVKIPGKLDMSEVDLLIHIMASLPDDYEVAVSALEDKLMDKNLVGEPTLETVREKIIMRHDLIKQHERNEEEKKAYAFFKKT